MAYTILYIATSADGFIADKNGGLDWLPQEAPEDQDFGFDDFVKSIDVIAQGSRTFLQTISFIDAGIVTDLPYQGKHMYVFTRQPIQTNRTDVTLVANIEEYLALIHQDHTIQRVWLLGGAELIASFKAYDLIDECIITVIPVKLDEGIALPANIFNGMELIESQSLFQNIIERKYIRKQH